MDGGSLEPLSTARDLIAGVPGVADVGQFEWYPARKSWALPFTLLAPPGGALPARSRWYLVSERRAGDGDLDVFPAAQGGLQRTFLHQMWNGPLAGAPWCTGAICPRSFPAARARYFANTEPAEFPDRGRWLVQGATRWVDAAASATGLARPGDPFELPVVPVKHDATVVYSESADHLGFWEPRIGHVGLVDIGELRRGGLATVLSFRDASGRGELDLRWGDAVRRIGKPRGIGAWIALRALPVLPPWHLPATWGELLRVLGHLLGGRDVVRTLAGLPGLHDCEPHALLLGAPIPSVVDGPAALMHWLVLQMPPLAGLRTPSPGFRPTEKSRALYNRSVALREGAPVDWFRSANWHPTALAVRGTHAELPGRRALLIGGGALGSPVGEMLVRGGLRFVHVFDDERVEGGNLTRHPALLINVGESKALTLSARLNLASPHAVVVPHNEAYPPRDREVAKVIQRCDLVIDATADDRVLRDLADDVRDPKTLFASAWLGFRGRRTYVYLARGSCFPFSDWQTACAPWLAVEREEIERHGLEWEGVGCWSPVFAAHAEDVCEAAVLAVRIIVDGLRGRHGSLTVFENGRDEHGLPQRRVLHGPADITREPVGKP